jgi:hypothetical protein
MYLAALPPSTKGGNSGSRPRRAVHRDLTVCYESPILTLTLSRGPRRPQSMAGLFFYSLYTAITF